MKNLFTMKNVLLLLFTVSILASCNEENMNGCGSGMMCSGTVGANETAATVPSSLVGSYTSTYDYAQSGSPFTNGTSATFELTANNELIVSIDGLDCITLSNPVYRFGATSGNYTFKDECLHDVAFNVSENQNGTFSEVNIEPNTGAGWFGQFPGN